MGSGSSGPRIRTPSAPRVTSRRTSSAPRFGRSSARTAGTIAVVYDLLAFCPWCGPQATPPGAVFEDNLAAQQRLLAVLDELPPDARESIAAAGGATALAERALTGVMAATQNLAKQLYAQAGKPPPKSNPWQNVERLRREWISAFGRDPLGHLPPGTIETLRLAFARRHLLEHNGGVVDEAYVRDAGEGTVGRRLRIRPEFVQEALDSAIALAAELEATDRR